MAHRVVPLCLELRPSGLNFLQLTQTVRTKGVNIALIAHLSRIHTELVVEAKPTRIWRARRASADPSA